MTSQVAIEKHLTLTSSSAELQHYCISSPPRRLIAFVGGLDLTGGRWDTPDFELYKSLLHEHDGDFRDEKYWAEMIRESS